VVEEDGFIKILKLLHQDVKIPSANTLRRDISQNFEKIKTIVKQKLQVSNFNKFKFM